jgi:type IV pilus assembly protein PilN
MMIKINLLPVKAAKKQAQGQQQVLIGAVILTLAIAAVYIFNSSQVAVLHTKKAQADELANQIEDLKKKLGNYDTIRAQRDELIKQADAIKQLQANRAGPVWLMRELSDILTKGKGPSFNKDQYEERIKRDPNAGFNANWDPKRVWMLNYAEKAHSVVIKGAAKSDEDVAEFLKRLKLSAFFSDVYWQKTEPAIDTKLSVAYVTFDVTCKVNY